MPTVRATTRRLAHRAADAARCLVRDERGSVTAEQVLVMPVLLSVVLLLAQAAVWAHAIQVAQATASDALAVTRVQNGTVAAGQTEANHMLDQLGRGPLNGVHVTVTREADHATVSITGTASSVVPFLKLPIHVNAAGPTEEFRSAAGGTP